MTNTNCLEGIQCPQCGNADRFRIVATSLFTVTDDGTEDHGDVEWDSTYRGTLPSPAVRPRSAAGGLHSLDPHPSPHPGLLRRPYRRRRDGSSCQGRFPRAEAFGLSLDRRPEGSRLWRQWPGRSVRPRLVGAGTESEGEPP